jgi:hypothetical protein
VPLSTATLVSAGAAAPAAGLLELLALDDVPCALLACFPVVGVDAVALLPPEEPPSDVRANTSAATPITTPPTIIAVTRPGERPPTSAFDRRDARELPARRAPLPNATAPSPGSDDALDRVAPDPGARTAAASTPACPSGAPWVGARRLPGAGGAGGAGGRRGVPGGRAGALGARGVALFVMFAAAAAAVAGAGAFGSETPGGSPLAGPSAAVPGGPSAAVPGAPAARGAAAGVAATALVPAAGAGDDAGGSGSPTIGRAGSGAAARLGTAPVGAPEPPTL